MSPRPVARTLLLSLLVALGVAQPSGGTPAATASDGPSAADALSGLPLYFVENAGQVPHRVAHYVQGSGASIGFTSTGIVYSLSSTQGVDEAPDRLGLPGAAGVAPARRRWTVRQDFVGANPVRPEGLGLTDAVVSYFKGPRSQWHTGLRTYSGLIYRGLWPGIDLVVSSEGGHPKSTFHVAPGADPSAIRLAWRGAQSVSLTPAGEIAVQTGVSSFTEAAPVSWQETSGGREPVASAYAPARRGREGFTYGFDLGHYDRSRPLVIDPVTFVYAGFIGGSGIDFGVGIAVDADGNAYVTGGTTSTEATFPDTVGPDLTHNGNFDAFVARVNADGTALDYAGYIGGSGLDQGLGIAVDGDGNAYVTGTTASTAVTFPATVGPDLTHNGGDDAFVARVNADGTALDYAGYLGGSAGDIGMGIAVDGDGNAYVTGTTASTDATFPDTVGPDLTHNGGDDAFVARVSADGTTLGYAGYIGGSGQDVGNGIAVDGDGKAYVTGGTDSTEATFPDTVGPDLTHNGGGPDAYVARVSADGTALDYAGYIGGSGPDVANGIAVDGDGNAYVTGYTDSTEATFPATVGPDLTHNGGFFGDAFVARVNAAGTALDYAGYIGGSGQDVGTGMAVDVDGNAYVTGFTDSPQATFPVAVGPDLGRDGLFDAFVARVNAAGTALDYAGFIGGNGSDFGSGITVDGDGNAYVTGVTGLSDSSLPATVGPDLTHNGNEFGNDDAFVAKISSPDPPPPETEADLSLTKADSRDPVTVGDTFAYGLRVTNAGPDDATDVTLVDTLPPEVSFSSAIPGQGTCDHDAGVVTCDLGTITVGELVQVRINVVAETAGTATNTATVTASEDDPTSPNEASAETTINAAPNGNARTLTVQRLGGGRGSVVSQPTGISCGRDCTEVYADEATVVLRARPRAGTTFDGWGGDCAHAGTNLTCTLVMDADKHVTATFNLVT